MREGLRVEYQYHQNIHRSVETATGKYSTKISTTVEKNVGNVETATSQLSSATVPVQFYTHATTCTL